LIFSFLLDFVVPICFFYPSSRETLTYSYMKAYKTLLCTFGILRAVSQANASTLYGSTSAGGPGELWIIDPVGGGGIQDIGPLNDSIGNNYPVTGLAFNPLTGVLYGSSANSNPATRGKLITINPATGLVTVVGAFNAGAGNTMADIKFDSTGNLYGISATGGANLYTVNITTGQGTIVAASGLTFTSGGGLAISPSGTFYGVPQGNDFGTFDPTTGAYTFVGTLATPAGNNTSYSALAFDGNTLYGVDLGSPPHLLIIDPTTVNTTDIGSTVSSIDAIAFKPAAAQPALSVTSTNNGVIVAWPASFTGFRLQQNTNLASTNWVANTNPTNVVNSTNQVTISPASGTRFFRLISP
jgi:hypothetical protein